MHYLEEKDITLDSQDTIDIEPTSTNTQSTEQCTSITEWLEQQHIEIHKKEQELFKQLTELGYADIISLEQIDLIEPDIEQDIILAETILKLKNDAQELLNQKKYYASVIPIEPSKLHIAIEVAEKVLAQNPERDIYQKDGALVRVVKRPICSPTSSFDEEIIISPIDYLNLVVLLTEVGTSAKMHARSRIPSRIDCPDKIARALIGKQEWKHIRQLRGTIDIPTLRTNGTILDKPGYDEESGLLFIENKNCIVPKISENPTREDIEHAKALLADLFHEFPFESPVDASAAYSMVITGLLRHIFPIAPMFAITATKRNTGKTYLAEQVALIVTGEELKILPPAENNLEEKKRLLALLQENRRIICYDNVIESFGSGALCAVITGKKYSDRVLGYSENKTVSTKALFIITGNNLSFKGDMATRVVLSKLNCNLEYPEKRDIKRKELSEYTLQNRGLFVWATLTIIRGFFAAGRPEQNAQSRFKEWSAVAQASLIWCGFEDPCANYQEIVDSDPIQNALVDLLFGLYELFGGAPFQVSEIVSITKKQVKNTNEQRLSDAICELFGNNVNTSKLGAQLRSYKDDIREGLKLVSNGRIQGTTLWKVIKV